jgi:DNA-binding NtrC family response regulator
MKKKVLVVDDDATIRQMYVPFFTGRGYDVRAAANGRQAIDIIKGERIDLVILDLNMPEMSGEEVLKIVADTDSWKRIPVVIDTASGERLNKIKAEFGTKLQLEFFQRPSSLDELSETIDRMLAL